MAKPATDAYRLFLGQLAKWPQDMIGRGAEVDFASIMMRRVKKLNKDPANHARIVEESKALYYLIQNRAKTMHPTPKNIMEPKTQPDYYKAIMKEFKDVSQRSWLSRKWLNFKGRLRLFG